MSSDAPPRRRRRAASPPPGAAPPAGAPPAASPARAEGKAASGLRRRIPPLLLLAAALGLALLAAAWTTRWPPGPPREAEQATRVTLEIPAGRQQAINNWERFFACYDLRDPAIIDLTLRANQRVKGNLDFPGERVLVEFPSAQSVAVRPTASSAEEDLVDLARRIQDATPDRRDCGA